MRAGSLNKRGDLTRAPSLDGEAPPPAADPIPGTAQVRRRWTGVQAAGPPGAPRGGRRQLWAPGARDTRAPAPGRPQGRCAGGRPDQRGGAPAEIGGRGQLAPPRSSLGPGRGGGKATWRGLSSAHRVPAAALRLAASRGRGESRAPERRPAARARDRDPPAAPSQPSLPKSPPVGASVACASAGATYPGQGLLLVQRALGLQR